MQQCTAMPHGGGAMAPDDARGPGGCGRMSRRKIGPVLGLAVAVGLMVLSLSAFVVGSNAGSNTGILVGQSAVNFSARDLGGQRHMLHDFHGRPVLLVFASTAEADLADFSDTLLPDDIQVLLLTSEIEPEVPTSGRGDPVVVLQDDGGLIARQYAMSARSIATEEPGAQAVLISADGEILDRGTLARLLGPTQAKEIR